MEARRPRAENEQAHTARCAHVSLDPSGSTIVRLGDCVLSSPLIPVIWANDIPLSAIEANTVAVLSLRGRVTTQLVCFGALKICLRACRMGESPYI